MDTNWRQISSFVFSWIRFVKSGLTEYPARKQVTIDGEECILDIFDTAGQEDFCKSYNFYRKLIIRSKRPSRQNLN